LRYAYVGGKGTVVGAQLLESLLEKPVVLNERDKWRYKSGVAAQRIKGRKYYLGLVRSYLQPIGVELGWEVDHLLESHLMNHTATKRAISPRGAKVPK
jgi:hypothetical protein